MAVRQFLQVPYNIGDIIEIRIIGILDGQQVMSTFHYKASNGGADLGAAYSLWLTDFNLNVWGAIQPLVSNELVSVTLSVQKIYPIRFRAKVQAAAPSAGAVASPSLPSGVSVVARRQANEANRKAQGRIYIPGIPSASVDASQLTAVALAPFRANVDPALLLGLEELGPDEVTPIIFNLKAPTNQLKPTFAITDQIIRYQRRREIGVGV